MISRINDVKNRDDGEYHSLGLSDFYSPQPKKLIKQHDEKVKEAPYYDTKLGRINEPPNETGEPLLMGPRKRARKDKEDEYATLEQQEIKYKERVSKSSIKAADKNGPFELYQGDEEVIQEYFSKYGNRTSSDARTDHNQSPSKAIGLN